MPSRSRWPDQVQEWSTEEAYKASTWRPCSVRMGCPSLDVLYAQNHNVWSSAPNRKNT